MGSWGPSGSGHTGQGPTLQPSGANFMAVFSRRKSLGFRQSLCLACQEERPETQSNRDPVLELHFVIDSMLGLSLVVPGGGVKKKAAAPPQAKPEGTAAPPRMRRTSMQGLC